MKTSATFAASLVFCLAAQAQSQAEVAPSAAIPASAASAADASTQEVAGTAVAKEVLVREGKIRKLQHRCERSSGVTGSRAEHVVQNTISQVSNKTGLGLVAQFLVGGAVGNSAGTAAENPEKVCTTEVRVTLTDDSDKSFDTVVPASIGRTLRIWQKGQVRIEDGKPAFWFN